MSKKKNNKENPEEISNTEKTLDFLKYAWNLTFPKTSSSEILKAYKKKYGVDVIYDM